MVALPVAPVEGLVLAGLGFARWSGRCDAAHAAVAQSSGARRAASGADTTAQARHHRALWGDAARFWSRDGETLRWLRALDEAIGRATPPPRPSPATDLLQARAPEAAAEREAEREAAREEACCPPIYRRTLRLLRAAARSGRWPASSERRQRVIEPQASAEAGTDADEEAGAEAGAEADATAMAQLVISRPNAAPAVAAACGSFSIGTMPPGCAAPRGNAIFAELMAAAFELEKALRAEVRCSILLFASLVLLRYSDFCLLRLFFCLLEKALCAEAPPFAALGTRRPSAMVAVNRNALFRPHRDTGAGRGQSKALIVGLGRYSGGELVIEGDAVDVRCVLSLGCCPLWPLRRTSHHVRGSSPYSSTQCSRIWNYSC